MYSKFQRPRARPAPAMNCTLRSTDGHDGAQPATPSLQWTGYRTIADDDSDQRGS